MVVTDLFNIGLAVETAGSNEPAAEASRAELGDDIRAFIDMFPGTRPMWLYFIESYPLLSDTEVFRTMKEALEG